MRFRFVIIIVLVLMVFSCKESNPAIESLSIAQGGMHNYNQINKLSFKAYLIEYNQNHLIIDSIITEHTLFPPESKMTVECNIQSFLSTPFYPLFPFSLMQLESKTTSKFEKVDTIQNKEYHIYSLHYFCQQDQEVDHQVFSISLNNQIRYHQLKLGERYFVIEPITWQKTGSILFPLRNKVFESNENWERIYLRYDLVYADIMVDN